MPIGQAKCSCEWWKLTLGNTNDSFLSDYLSKRRFPWPDTGNIWHPKQHVPQPSLVKRVGPCFASDSHGPHGRVPYENASEQATCVSHTHTCVFLEGICFGCLHKRLPPFLEGHHFEVSTHLDFGDPRQNRYRGPAPPTPPCNSECIDRVAFWVLVPAPLMPLVALVELPPQKELLSNSTTRPPFSTWSRPGDRFTALA